MSRLLPVDVERQPFQKAWRGYSPDEVRQFLKLVAEEQENLVLRATALEDELKGVKARVAEFEERERIMREALYAAQKAAEETRQNALKERELLLKEAEQRADRLLDDARLTSIKIERESMDLKLLRDDALRELETLLLRFGALLELYKQSRAGEDKLRMLGRAEEAGG